MKMCAVVRQQAHFREDRLYGAPSATAFRNSDLKGDPRYCSVLRTDSAPAGIREEVGITVGLIGHAISIVSKKIQTSHLIPRFGYPNSLHPQI